MGAERAQRRHRALGRAHRRRRRRGLRDGYEVWGRRAILTRRFSRDRHAQLHGRDDADVRAVDLEGASSGEREGGGCSAHWCAAAAVRERGDGQWRRSVSRDFGQWGRSSGLPPSPPFETFCNHRRGRRRPRSSVGRTAGETAWERRSGDHARRNADAAELATRARARA